MLSWGSRILHQSVVSRLNKTKAATFRYAPLSWMWFQHHCWRCSFDLQNTVHLLDNLGRCRFFSVIDVFLFFRLPRRQENTPHKIVTVATLNPILHIICHNSNANLILFVCACYASMALDSCWHDREQKVTSRQSTDRISGCILLTTTASDDHRLHSFIMFIVASNAH